MNLFIGIIGAALASVSTVHPALATSGVGFFVGTCGIGLVFAAVCSAAKKAIDE